MLRMWTYSMVFMMRGALSRSSVKTVQLACEPVRPLATHLVLTASQRLSSASAITGAAPHLRGRDLEIQGREVACPSPTANEYFP